QPGRGVRHRLDLAGAGGFETPRPRVVLDVPTQPPPGDNLLVQLNAIDSRIRHRGHLPVDSVPDAPFAPRGAAGPAADTALNHGPSDVGDRACPHQPRC